jgi:hypothetical protein
MAERLLVLRELGSRRLPRPTRLRSVRVGKTGSPMTTALTLIQRAAFFVLVWALIAGAFTI